MNESDAKKEYELKKQEKLQQKELVSKGDKRSGSSKKFLWILVIIIIIVLIFISLKSIVKNNTPTGEDFSTSVPNAGREHIAVGTIPTEGTYTSNPPSSGPHYPNTARAGFYDVGEPVEDQFVIHNLEHGDIWIAYKPNVSQSTKNILEKFAGRFVVVSPREANKEDIALVSWGRIDTFSEKELTEQRIKDFVLRHDNKGPEQVRGAGHSSIN